MATLFPGTTHILDNAAREANDLGEDLLNEDIEDERELLATGFALDQLEGAPIDAEDESASETVNALDSSTEKKIKLSEAVSIGTSDIIVDSTRGDYERAWVQFIQFCVAEKLIDNSSVIEKELVLNRTLPPDFATWIVAWIMSKADSTDIHTGEQLHPDIPRVTYGAAQKMRAAMTHKFGRDFGFGAAPWMENPMQPGQYVGNPSLSPVVSQYMISLRRRKARSGEVVTSARAINEDVMQKMWAFNSQVPRLTMAPMVKKRKATDIDGPVPPNYKWAGYCVRVMLHCLYTISLLCLLRYDEALNIRWEDVTAGFGTDGIPRIIINLYVRKTAQNGHIAPFYLYLDLDKPWMCAVSAFALWWQLAGEMGIQRHGYMFRKRCGYDRVSYDAADRMSSDSFLVCFRNNLCDIKINPRMYGTHSFRRGGCQYLHVVKRWAIRDICAWGGWSDNFDTTGTIFKYLISFTDKPMIDRADYFNPNRMGTDPCNSCGRRCNCA